ncbi:unnamed protein product [Calypogeia fissa]
MEKLTTSPLYTVESIPGKGLGFVAARDIAKGTRIIAEKALFRVPNMLVALFGEQVVTNYISGRLNLLSGDEQKAFLSLRHTSPVSSLLYTSIFRTNSLPLGPDSTEAGLFVKIARINHSCHANCQNTWNETLSKETIHAVRRIPKGEEITINYTSGGTFETRRLHLKSQFGFDCTCELCSLPEVERIISDGRLNEIERLDKLISDAYRLLYSPHKCLEDAYTQLTLLEAENITNTQVARLYFDAFQIVICCGDLARAKVFAERAYDANLYTGGNDNPDTAQMKSLIANPAQHRLFGVSKIWKQSVKMIPRRLEGDKFEAWLWRRNK